MASVSVSSRPVCAAGDACARSARPADLAHDGVVGETASVIHILVADDPPMDRLPEQPIKPVDGVFAPTAVAQRHRSQIGQSGRVIKFAHHQETAIRTEPRALELQSPCTRQ